ncbi:NAD(P)H-binding protein [Candidatus Solirubrobacter pratensis]|uniref:NAD(P)H-binding protein n=1 Tax=Candidatus Solirubrobacter pratensis TaxID=1298857 RepID=UPI000425373B|nr:NAD(P)H-binding protein [Candidatus Solirubrobacter pratensis]
MIVLVAGANGRLGGLLVALLLGRGHTVRGLVRRQDEAGALEEIGAAAVVGDLRGDIEWAVDGCDAAIFAAGARHRAQLEAIDGGGAAKLAEAADRFGLRRFVLCSAVGAGAPERRQGPLRDFLAAKHHAERRLEHLDMPWTILRFGRLTDATGTGRISTVVPPGTPVTLSRDDAALAVAEALDRDRLARRVVHVIGGDRHVADALDAVEPAPLPPVYNSGLGAGQADNPPPDPEMLLPDASPLDADVDYEGEGPLPPELVGNDDPAPGIP